MRTTMMRHKGLTGLLILGIFLAGGPVLAAKVKGDNPPAPRGAEERAPAFDPQAREILLKMCAFMKAQSHFSFKAEVTDDKPEQDGAIIQNSFDLDAWVRRPDRMRVDGEGDVVGKQFYYDGKTFTLYDKAHNVYATEEVPGDIEGALDKAHRDYNLTIALADMASASLCEHMSQGIGNGVYVGVRKVRGIPSHQFAFDRGDDHFQIWVDAGEAPLIRKIVITRGGLPHSPQWSATFTEWNLDPQLDESIFAFSAPQGAEKIEFARAQTTPLPTVGSGGRKKKGGGS